MKTKKLALDQTHYQGRFPLLFRPTSYSYFPNAQSPNPRPGSVITRGLQNDKRLLQGKILRRCAHQQRLGVVVSFNRTSFNRTGTPAVRGLKAAWIALGEATLGGVTLVRATFASTVWL